MAIFLSAGHHKKDSGAIGVNNRQENLEAIKVRDKVVFLLKKRDYNVITDSDNETLGEYLKRIKPGDGSVVVEFHFDAYNSKASGTTVLIADSANNSSKNLAKELVTATSTALNIANRGVKRESESNRGKLAFVREEGACCLVEICFIDNKEDMSKYDSHIDKLCQKYAEIIGKYEDVIK